MNTGPVSEGMFIRRWVGHLMARSCEPGTPGGVWKESQDEVRRSIESFIAQEWGWPQAHTKATALMVRLEAEYREAWEIQERLVLRKAILAAQEAEGLL